MTRACIVALLVCLGFDAWPRDDAGALQTVVFPNEGRPAVTVAGGAFTALATREVGLTLRDGDVVIPLAATWRRVPGAKYAAECRVPAECRPGTYAIAADDSDVNAGAVTVLSETPDSYSVAHLAAPRLGAEDSEALSALAASINAQSPSLIVVSGALTSSGTEAEMRQALDFLRSLHAPALATPAPGDDRTGQFARFFGPPVYAMRFGEDAYMAIGVDAAPREEHFGPMYRARRAVRDARWSVGVASVNPVQWPMRAQLALFVDDPLDFLLVPGGDAATQSEVRWGATIALQTPNAANGTWRLLRVEPYTPSPGKLISIVPVPEESSTSAE